MEPGLSYWNLRFWMDHRLFTTAARTPLGLKNPQTAMAIITIRNATGNLLFFTIDFFRAPPFRHDAERFVCWSPGRIFLSRSIRQGVCTCTLLPVGLSQLRKVPISGENGPCEIEGSMQVMLSLYTSGRWLLE